MTPPAASFPFEKCRFCGGTGPFRRLEAREMMFGWRHVFAYLECGSCGSLQIERIPENLAEYYPKDYYSLAVPVAHTVVVPVLRRVWARWLVRSWSGLARRMGRQLYRKSPFFTWVRLAGCGLEAAILDVGCGSGGLLQRMRRYGFSHLTGVDPYTAAEASRPGLQIMRGELSVVRGQYDLVMFHHVLEHLADPTGTLATARTLLAPGGRILVRIPVAGSRACREYGEHWFNLDAPRHLAIPSLRGMTAIADAAGLTIVHTEFDSAEPSFIMSENYRRGVPMKAAPRPSRSEQRHFRRLARKYNHRGEGDLGVFLLAPRQATLEGQPPADGLHH